MSGMQRAPDGQYEMVLENRQVLTIFFVVVVLCGVCFGLGYIVGKNTMGYIPPAESPTAAVGKKSAITPSSGLAESTAPPASSSDAGQKAPESAPVRAEPAQAAGEVAAAKSEPASSTAQMKPVSAVPATPAAAASFTELVHLQVAALSKKEDAESLLALLKKKGFPATMATSPADHLFRVQVGPFSSAADAEEMKARLEREGFKTLTKK